jgi:hypothetical protein
MILKTFSNVEDEKKHMLRLHYHPASKYALAVRLKLSFRVNTKKNIQNS